jgi:hypothetical protein
LAANRTAAIIRAQALEASFTKEQKCHELCRQINIRHLTIDKLDRITLKDPRGKAADIVYSIDKGFFYQKFS